MATRLASLAPSLAIKMAVFGVRTGVLLRPRWNDASGASASQWNSPSGSERTSMRN